MFYQVRVSAKHRSFQKFLWWEGGDTSKRPIEYQMIVHLFGSSSSPSCANFALRKTAEDQQDHFDEEVVETVRRNFYVDDCLKSLPSVTKAQNMVQDLKAIFAGGGFHISKWISNNREVLSTIPICDRAKEIKDLDLDKDDFPLERTLGVNWSIDSDSFCFTVDVKDKPYTRRGILSTISSIYDPLGFIAPLVLQSKILLQELCHLLLGWDDPISDKMSEKWSQWLTNVHNMSDFKVSRCFKPEGFGKVESSELHHFADASEAGYGTVSYLRLTNSLGRVHCSFVLGKSRVAPLKKITVPRLELAAATLAVRCDRMLKQEIDLKIDKTVFWTDSMSVLRYINNSSSRFQTYVANRLTIIHEGSSVEQWHYISSKLNPADHASRGMLISLESWLSDWIEAPKFLRSEEVDVPETFPQKFEAIENDPEIKRAISARTELKSEVNKPEFDPINSLIHSCSSWYKLKKRVAWILRVKGELLERVRRKNNKKLSFKPKDCSNHLSVEEMSKAEEAILYFVQTQAFTDEMRLLEKGQNVKRNSKLRRLDPIYCDGLIRVGGRLQRSNMPAESIHPIILPKDHHVSVLILRQIHDNLRHTGRNHMLAKLREKYWLIRAPTSIRKLISKCITCRRLRSPVGEQKMSVLPQDRVTPCEPPFTRVGVDYFGPFEVKVKRSRVKRYGVIFTCLASRAIHLEVAFSLDTDSYLHAVRRFIARRGQVKKMFSDNGSNFIGAERELKQSLHEWNFSQIHNEMLQRDIEWSFNPPLGSHHGGVWERLIRSVRNAINCTLRGQTLNDEGLMTLLCEVESVLNDRPVTRATDQHNDLEALTPNHLLLLKKKPNLPPGLFQASDCYHKRRWRQVQYMANIFWKRWTREYLPLLQERQKWHERKRNLSTGDVVLVVDSSAPRNSWPMALVVETFPDRLGLVRRVKVKTASNTLIRPIDKLCLLLEAELD